MVALTVSNSLRGVGNRAACVTAPHSPEEVMFTTSDMVPGLVQSQTWKPRRYPKRRRRLMAKSDQIPALGSGNKTSLLKCRPGTQGVPS